MPISLVKKHNFRILFLLFVLFAIWTIDLLWGSVTISLRELWTSLFGYSVDNEIYKTIILDWRLPKSIVAIVVGAGLSGVGLVLQTLFRNPMADASVLGISSGASLGVAVFLLTTVNVTSSYFQTSGLLLSAIVGAFLVMLLIITLNFKIKNVLSVLIIGLMFNAIVSSVISVLSFFAPAQNLQRYFFWGMGSLGHLFPYEILILTVVVFLCLLGFVRFLKPMNVLLLSENFTQNLGFNVKKINSTLLISSSIIIGVLTAFVGPIAFIGLAVPHVVKLWLRTSNHLVLYPTVLIVGSIVLLSCDILSQSPFLERVLPINAITSLLGAPIVIFLILKRKVV